MSHVPSPVALAARDPKVASDSNLLRAINFFSDDLHPDMVQDCVEELSRRDIVESLPVDDYSDLGGVWC